MILVDSSFLIAFHNERDVHHRSAVQATERLLAGQFGQALLLEYVFLEVATVLLARRGLETATRVASVLLNARELDFVPCSDIFLDTLETFRAQGTGRLSFTDAAIVTVARGHEGARIATFDRGFQELRAFPIIPE